MSYLASTITNIAIRVHGKKGAKLTEVKDFILDWDSSKPKGTQSVEDMKRVFTMIAAANSKKDSSRALNRKRIPKSLRK